MFARITNIDLLFFAGAVGLLTISVIRWRAAREDSARALTSVLIAACFLLVQIVDMLNLSGPAQWVARATMLGSFIGTMWYSASVAPDPNHGALNR